jgi:hypothetical protein
VGGGMRDKERDGKHLNKEKRERERERLNNKKRRRIL